MPPRKLRRPPGERALRAIARFDLGTGVGRIETASPVRDRPPQITEIVSIPRTVLFNFVGSLSTGIWLAWRPTFSGRIISVRCNTTDAPTGTITVDVLKNATSIFPTATKPTVPAAAEYGTARTPDTTAFASNDKLQIEVEDIGTDGANLVVAVEYSR